MTDEEENNKDVIQDKIIKYIKTDDIMKKKSKEFKDKNKVLKERKDKMEDKIINYFNKQGETKIDIIDNGKIITQIIKTENIVKKPITIELIQECIINECKKEKLFSDKKKFISFVENTLNMIEDKRPIFKKTVLKKKDVRTRIRKIEID